MMSSSQEPHSTASVPEKKFFGQPRALANVFGVEMWERFSFYGMQGILAIYLYYSVADGGLGLDEPTALGIVGAYGGAVYLSTIVGAWIADRLFGAERVLFGSAIVIVAGHVALAVIPGFAGVAVGLILVALGSGGLKATATAVIGTLYSADDPRRDAGFSLFYLGINLGSFFGPILTGLLQSRVGFHWGFGAAALGMIAGLIQYSLGRRRLPDEARVVANPLPKNKYPVVAVAVVLVIAAIVTLVAVGVIRADNLALVVIVVVVAATIAYFALITTSRKITGDERSRVFAFMPLFIASVAFWSLYQQQFTVLVMYSDVRLNRSLFGWEMPVSWVNSINPVFIVVLAGAAAALWTKLGSRQPSTPVKFALGTALMGIAFLLFLPVANGAPHSTPLLWLVLILLTFTVAELLLSPVGLSVTTKLAPAAFHTQMIALFYLSISLGTAIAGAVATFYDPTNEVPYFTILGAIAIGIGLLVLASARPILRLMKGVR